MATKKKKDYIYTVGRRKEAVARVRLFKGKGKSIVNDKPINEYFPSEQEEFFYSKPF